MQSFDPFVQQNHHFCATGTNTTLAVLKCLRNNESEESGLFLFTVSCSPSSLNLLVGYTVSRRYDVTILM